MNDRHVGTCGDCGGRVMVPSVWFGVVPPEPTCVRCGATAAPLDLPVMRMRRMYTSDRVTLNPYDASGLKGRK